MKLDELSSLLEAVSFAARAHRHGVRKDGETPYVAHVFRVTAIVRNFFGFSDPRMLTTCVLHDTIEDTTTDFDDLAEQFGPEIATWVAFLTKNATLPEETREAEYVAQLARAPWQVKVCKLGDMTDNLLDSRNLPPEKRKKIHSKLRRYFDALAQDSSSEMREPIAKFRAFLESV